MNCYTSMPKAICALLIGERAHQFQKVLDGIVGAKLRSFCKTLPGFGPFFLGCRFGIPPAPGQLLLPRHHLRMASKS